jgi:hypothetical protein
MTVFHNDTHLLIKLQMRLIGYSHGQSNSKAVTPTPDTENRFRHDDLLSNYDV